MGWWALWSSGSKKDPDAAPKNSHVGADDEAKDSPSPSSSSSHSAASSSSSSCSASSKRATNWNSILNATDWAQFKEPRNLIPTILLTGGVLLVVHLHRRFLRRIPEATDISSSYFRRRSLLGWVTSVGDGDNFRMYHTPGGRLAGWGWLPWKKIPTSKKGLKDRTIHIRLAGVDAPELSHFGRPAQPFSEEAHAWLTSFLLNRRVRAYVHRADQYKRVIATVYVRRLWDFPFPFRRRDVSYEMLKRGLATVYEAKTGVEFGSKELERRYRAAEQLAKERGRGLWKEFRRRGGQDWESPREYKTRMGLEQPVEGQQQQPPQQPSSNSSSWFSLSSWLFPSWKKKNDK